MQAILAEMPHLLPITLSRLPPSARPTVTEAVTAPFLSSWAWLLPTDDVLGASAVSVTSPPVSAQGLRDRGATNRVPPLPYPLMGRALHPLSAVLSARHLEGGCLHQPPEPVLHQAHYGHLALWVDTSFRHPPLALPQRQLGLRGGGGHLTVTKDLAKMASS